MSIHVLPLVENNTTSESSSPAPRVGEKTVAGYSIIVAILLMGLGVLFASGTASSHEFLARFPTEIIFILISLDLISKFISHTGALTSLSLKLAAITDGEMYRIAIVSGVFTFATSAVLNNLAATFVLASVFLAVLRDLKAPRKVVATTLAMQVCVTNLGGAATPIGDFPAIILMTSGAVEFLPYLLTALPLFATTALLAINFYALRIQRMEKQIAVLDPSAPARSRTTLSLLLIKNRGRKTDWKRAGVMAGIFASMVTIWALVDPQTIPFHLTAIVGCALIALAAGPKAVKHAFQYDLTPTIFIIAVLSIATMAGSTGWLESLATHLKQTFDDPVVLLIAVMFVTALASGLVSAGPAAAAMLPLIVELSNGPLSHLGAWPGTAFAAAICAGSSLFITSATAGPALAGEAHKSNITQGQRPWGFSEYLVFGVVNCLFQFTVALLWILVAISDQISEPTKLLLAISIPAALFILTVIRAKSKNQHPRGSNVTLLPPTEGAST